MVTNTDFQQMHERSRAQAFQDANRVECRKCHVRDVPIDVHQLCFACAEKKRQTKIDPAAAPINRSVPVNESPEACNRRLQAAMSERNAKKMRPTVGRLVMGGPGVPRATGALLSYCDQVLVFARTLRMTSSAWAL